MEMVKQEMVMGMVTIGLVLLTTSNGNGKTGNGNGKTGNGNENGNHCQLKCQRKPWFYP